jgi:nicotinamidase-related amidase
MAKTLLELAGAAPQPARMSEGVLVLIDMQNEYYSGALGLPDAEAATAKAAAVLTRARARATPVIHIRHKGRPGGAFDPAMPRFQIHDSLTPVAGEVVIDKGLPNSFAGTTLADALAPHEGKPLILMGFMTHMCVSATARSAVDHGRFSTILSDTCATRDLPDPTVPGGTIAAATVHAATLAALADRFAVVCTSDALPE